MWPRPRRASASARRTTRRLLAERRVRPDVQPRLDTSLPWAAARLPCRTSSWSHRRGGQLRRGGCASAQRLVWIGGGGVGASLHPALAGRLIETDERIERRAALPSSGFQGQKKASPAPSLSEIAISLNCGLNSARKFQTGVSNSGAQIPKHARQNSEVPEITYFS